MAEKGTIECGTMRFIFFKTIGKKTAVHCRIAGWLVYYVGIPWNVTPSFISARFGMFPMRFLLFTAAALVQISPRGRLGCETFATGPSEATEVSINTEWYPPNYLTWLITKDI